jgi:hypothetical protein
MPPIDSNAQNMELPTPSPEVLTGGAGEQAPLSDSLANSHEAMTASSSQPMPQTQTAASQFVSSPTQPAQLAGATSPTLAQPANQTLQAADLDLIEKEWVIKAKQIVASTHGDPHKQNKEINKIKADYIKKRYNKDIKLTAEE